MASSPVPRVPGRAASVLAALHSQPAALLSGLPEGVCFAFAYHDRLGRLLLHLAEHIDQPLTLANAANIACMERTSFSKFFRQKTGMSFKDFIHRLRINQAAQLLVKHDLSITEISQRVGYGCVLAFQRHFKKEIGLPAREYRARFVLPTNAKRAAA